MKILLFGATGMVGQGVLRECLVDPTVEQVVTVGREATGKHAPKLRELVLADLFAIETIASELGGFDACFFCLGVSSLGMAEADYTHITHDLTLTIATLLARLNPAMTFIYVTGAGTDATGRSRQMWARVKGRTENDLHALPFKASYMFRPGFIQPLHGVVSKTGWYNALYRVIAPLGGLLARRLPGIATTTEKVGRAMIAVAAHGYRAPILESTDINDAADQLSF
jgi:uncharacterized protein YbjT (DUF2867 family)